MQHSQQTMSDYYNAGFKTILPIIPPGAPISSQSVSLKDKPDMLGKIPGLLREDGWVGMGDWTNRDATQRDLAQWEAWDCGIGLRCRDVIAVDIDVTDPQLAQAVLDCVQTVAKATGGVAPVRTGNAPKVLALFKGSRQTKTVLPFYDLMGDKHAVEILGARQQFVVEGIHPKTGKPYGWDTDLVEVGLQGLPELTEDDILDLFMELRIVLEGHGCSVEDPSDGNNPDARDFDGLKCSDPQLLQQAVDAIPNTDDTSREFFVKMAHAIKGASIEWPEQGLEIFQSWADRRPSGQADGEPARVFDSVKTAGVGIQWIMERAREFGFNPVGADFGADDVEHGPAPDVDSWAPEDEDADNIWSRYVYVNAIKRFVDLRNGQRLDKEQFNDRHRSGDPKEKAVDIFLDNRRPHSFADVVGYRPGDTARVVNNPDKGRVELNMWRPGPAYYVDPKKSVTDTDVSLWLDLGKHLFPDEFERNTLINWMAHLLQYPGVKPNWHPLLGSLVHGTGKDSFMAPLVLGLGENTSVIQMSDFEAEWTWWAENVQLVVVSEISSFERKAVMNKMKSYMATPPDTIDINIKGLPQYSVRNLFGMVLFTNDENGAAIERHDRRLFVLWSDAQVLPAAWYSRYYDWLHNGNGVEAVTGYLLQRDLSGFSVRGNAPATEAKEVMRKAAQSSIEGALETGLQDGEGPFDSDLFTINDVEVWLRGKGFRPIGPHKVASLLKSIGCYNLGRSRIDDDQKMTGLWACRRVDMYQQMKTEHGMARLVTRFRAMRAGDVAADFEIEDKTKPGE